MLGAPFFLMDHVDGAVPPDVMPYTFGGNWFADASPSGGASSRMRLSVLAKLHSIPNAATTFGFLTEVDPPGDTPFAPAISWLKDWYQFAVPDVGRSHWSSAPWSGWRRTSRPRRHRRTGAVMGRLARSATCCTTTSARRVLDWEMATVGPRELDVRGSSLRTWCFRIAGGDAPGLPGVLREDDVARPIVADRG